MLSAAVVTMVLTPFISGLTTPIYELQRKHFGGATIKTIDIAWKGLSGHVVIAGGGRVGLHVAKVLKEFGVESLVIEADHRRFEEIRRFGIPAIYGDASQSIIIEAAGIERAKLLMVTIPSIATAKAAIHHATEKNGEIPVVARSEGVLQMKELYGSGVGMVVFPELEAGLELTRQALLLFDFAPETVQSHCDSVRAELYAPIRGMDDPLPEKGGYS
jgi:CPA2 family monovalent cation:H+ antiporter-2